MTWTPEAKQGNELFKIRHEIVQYTRGKGLDIGCGPTKTYPHFIGVDNGRDSLLYHIPIKPDVWIDDCGDLSTFGSQSMDFCISSHLLEHVEYSDVPKTLKEWIRVIKSGGYLVLYLPDEDEYPKIGTPGANVDHRFNVNYDVIIEAMEQIPRGWDLIDFQKRNKDDEYSLYFVFRID